MRAAMVIVGISLLGCASTVGPLVVDIQPGAGGAIVLQRCYVQFSAMSSEISMQRCESRTVPLSR